MTDEFEPTEPLVVSAKDTDLGGIFSDAFAAKYEIHSYRNAARILQSVRSEELRELVAVLNDYQISTDEMVAGGGSKSTMVRRLDDKLSALGWYETKIEGDLYFRTIAAKPNPKYRTNGRGRKYLSKETAHVIHDVISGHKIDFVKDRVAFDVEWNSKDQTFDRDLYAMRTFYEAGIIDAGVILTRDTSLSPLFADIGSRVKIKDFKSKYGASTTWMGKLTFRLDAGRNGGCPILALGITPRVVSDYDEWKESNPVVGKGISPDELTRDSDNGAD